MIEHAGRVALARNEREEWELPGGRLEAGEEPEDAVVREVREELGLAVRARELVDAWTYAPDGTTVVIVVYACELLGAPELTRSHEHSDVRWFAVEDVGGLAPPDGYKRSIARARGLTLARGGAELVGHPSKIHTRGARSTRTLSDDSASGVAALTNTS